MALEQDSIQEIKRYMDERAEHWQATARSDATKTIADEFSRRDQSSARRLQTMTAIGGVSLAALLTFAYTGISSFVGNLANERLTAFTTDEHQRRQERTEALRAELDVLKDSLDKIVEGRAQVSIAVQGAQSALSNANDSLNVAKGLEEEIKSRLEDATSAVQANARLATTVEENTERVAQALEANSDLNEELNVSLVEAENQLRELRALSDALDEAKLLAAEIDNSRSNVVEAVLRNASLREQIATTAALPAGTVLAFDLPGGCPNSWSPFAEGQGRTIVGASFGLEDNLFRSEPLTQRKYRDHGGEERVVLTEAEIPSHSHSVEYVLAHGNDIRVVGTNGTQFTRRLASNARNVESQHSVETTKFGKAGAHNNMPPYIALYFCKKD